MSPPKYRENTITEYSIAEKNLVGRAKEKILHNDFNIEMSKNLEREVSLMCNLSQSVVDRTLLDAIRNLMETMKLTVEQAMAALKIPEAEQPKYASMLKNK